MYTPLGERLRDRKRASTPAALGQAGVARCAPGGWRRAAAARLPEHEPDRPSRRTSPSGRPSALRSGHPGRPRTRAALPRGHRLLGDIAGHRRPCAAPPISTGGPGSRHAVAPGAGFSAAIEGGAPAVGPASGSRRARGRTAGRWPASGRCPAPGRGSISTAGARLRRRLRTRRAARRAPPAPTGQRDASTNLNSAAAPIHRAPSVAQEPPSPSARPARSAPVRRASPGAGEAPGSTP